VTPLAQILRMNGFSTAAFGKYHETPPWEVSTSGPYDRWPTGSGFDKFYGFIGGETNQWAPAIYDGVTRVEHDMSPTYHFTTDMTNQAIKWVSAQHSLTPDKPFYMYFATGATHAPHHVPKEWIAKYKGEFAGGWDKLREETYARQKEMGIIPADAAAEGNPGLGRHERRPEAPVRAADGDLRGLRRAHGPRSRPARCAARGARRARQHALLLHRRRQRRERRGRP
jgi:arylsulfatase